MFAITFCVFVWHISHTAEAPDEGQQSSRDTLGLRSSPSLPRKRHASVFMTAGYHSIQYSDAVWRGRFLLLRDLEPVFGRRMPGGSQSLSSHPKDGEGE